MKSRFMLIVVTCLLANLPKQAQSALRGTTTPDSDDNHYSTFRGSKSIESQCKDDIAWENSLWRTAVKSPTLCSRSSENDAAPNLGVEELVDSLSSRTKCGAFCVFHREALSISSSASTVKGWSLIDEGSNGENGCWAPVSDMKAHGCGAWYDKWSEWMGTKEKYNESRPSESEKMEPLGEIETIQTASSHTRCDKLDLDGGSNYWKDSTRQVVHVSPGNETSQVCGPRILIIGAMKCGTNTVGDLLLRHPRMKINRCLDASQPECDSKHFMGGKRDFWEMHALTHRFETDGMQWKANYAKILPQTNGVDSITVDKSPSYFNTEIFPGVAQRAKEILPNAKVVVSLCNPAERVYSEYHHNMKYLRKNVEAFFEHMGEPMPSDFSSFVQLFSPDEAVCQRKPGYCEKFQRNYLRTGQYDVHLRVWREIFGNDNVLVLNMEDSAREKMKKLLHHVGDDLPADEYPWDSLPKQSQSFVNRHYAGRASGHVEHSSAMKWLKNYFAPHNERLSHDLEADWPLRWNKDQQRQYSERLEGTVQPR